MENQKRNWDDIYRDVESLSDLRPSFHLVNYAPLIPAGYVLDLGAGEGSNSLFFAQRGFSVDAVDISKTALERAKNRAESSNLRIDFKVADLRNLDIPPSHYSLIIAKMVFQFLCVSDIKKVIQKCKDSLVTGGFIYMSVFSTEDPSLEFLRGESERLEKNTYFNDRLGSPMHFFTLEEVRQHFTDFEIILLSFSKRLDISHGEPHYHGVISCMAKKI